MYWNVSVGLKCVLTSRRLPLTKCEPLKTSVSMKTIRSDDIAQVNLIFGGKLFATRKHIYSRQHNPCNPRCLLTLHKHSLKRLNGFQSFVRTRKNIISHILLSPRIFSWRGTGGREPGRLGAEGYGKRERKGRDAGALRVREAGEKCKTLFVVIY